MITLNHALEIISSLAKSFGTEAVLLDNALDRVLSENISANRDYPPFNRSAMDGIAINHEDFSDGIRQFSIIQTIYAGKQRKTELTKGTCYKIMTGAAVPPSANAVIRNEDLEFFEKTAQIKTDNCQIYQNIARKGQDVKNGETILHTSQKINSSIISLLASLGRQEVLVQKFPKVAIFTTGNEVKPVSAAVTDVQIHNSNIHLLKALLKKNNITPVYCEHIPDNKKSLEAKLKKGLSCDITIINGGVSAGDADFVPETLEKLRVTKLFHKVAIKPGKPVWCGKTVNDNMVFALPGNPFSCLVTFRIFVEHYLNKCMGIEDPLKELPLSGTRNKKSNLEEFFPVKIKSTWELEQLKINGSGDIRLGLHADALAFHPAEETHLAEGKKLKYKLLY